MSTKFYIIIRTQFEGCHYWKDAPLEVDFLRAPHRHIFHVEVKLPVSHNDRELEFFLVKRFLDDAIDKLYPSFELKNKSCEMIAEEILKAIQDKFGFKKDVSVSVSEDNENGSVVET